VLIKKECWIQLITIILSFLYWVMNSEKPHINMKCVDIMEPTARAPTPPPPMKRWFPVLIATIVVANVILFVVTMYENNCPKNSLPPAPCFPSFLDRFSFQPLKQNPLLSPSDYPRVLLYFTISQFSLLITCVKHDDTCVCPAYVSFWTRYMWLHWIIYLFF